MATPISGAEHWLKIRRNQNNRPFRFIAFHAGQDNAALDVREYSEYLIQLGQEAPGAIEILIDDTKLETAVYGTWLWRPQHYAGLYTLEFRGQGIAPQTTSIRVFPHKMTQQRYEKMQAELGEIALDLLFRLDSPASERAISVPRERDTSALHDYYQMRALIGALGQVMAAVSLDPHQGLREETIQREWLDCGSFTDDLQPSLDEWISLPATRTTRRGVRTVPRYWTQSRSELTHDTYENRLLKQFLVRQLPGTLTRIQEQATREKEHINALAERYHDEEKRHTVQRFAQAIAQCQQMKERCVQWRSVPFLQQVSLTTLADKATPLLLKHPAYSRFYRLYLQFQRELKITRDTATSITQLALRKVSELYELWSVFFLTRMAIDLLEADGYQMISNTTFYEIRQDHLQFDVQKNSASIILAREGTHVRFIYEPVYPNKSTMRERSGLVADMGGRNPQTPDMAIEVYQHDLPRTILLFDAKYRWQRDPDGSYLPKEEDLQTMHSYKNRIKYQHYRQERGREVPVLVNLVQSAYILYPGNQVYSDAGDELGGLPLKPALPPALHAAVQNRLETLLKNADLLT